MVIYGDSNNWFAAWAFWQMKIYGHKDVRLMNGGRKKWISEGRDLDTGKTAPRPAPSAIRPPNRICRCGPSCRRCRRR